MHRLSKDPRQPLNLYGILDNEMARMHALMQTYLTLPQQQVVQNHHSSYGGLSSGASFSGHGNMPEIYKRILHMQDLLLKAVTSHDVVIQEKIAELALTGDAGETKT